MRKIPRLLLCGRKVADHLWLHCFFMFSLAIKHLPVVRPAQPRRGTSHGRVRSRLRKGTEHYPIREPCLQSVGACFFTQPSSVFKLREAVCRTKPQANCGRNKVSARRNKTITQCNGASLFTSLWKTQRRKDTGRCESQQRKWSKATATRKHEVSYQVEGSVVYRCQELIRGSSVKEIASFTQQNENRDDAMEPQANSRRDAKKQTAERWKTQ